MTDKPFSVELESIVLSDGNEVKKGDFIVIKYTSIKIVNDKESLPQIVKGIYTCGDDEDGPCVDTSSFVGTTGWCDLPDVFRKATVEEVELLFNAVSREKNNYIKKFDKRIVKIKTELNNLRGDDE